MTHDPHLFLNIHVVCSAGEKARLVIRKPSLVGQRLGAGSGARPSAAQTFWHPDLNQWKWALHRPWGQGRVQGPLCAGRCMRCQGSR